VNDYKDLLNVKVPKCTTTHNDAVTKITENVLLSVEITVMTTEKHLVRER
jgi:hypothetical protein